MVSELLRGTIGEVEMEDVVEACHSFICDLQKCYKDAVVAIPEQICNVLQNYNMYLTTFRGSILGQFDQNNQEPLIKKILPYLIDGKKYLDLGMP